MDTNLAITTLQTLSQNLGAQISLATTNQQAVDLAVSQLQATLTTQLTALAQVQSQLDTTNATLNAIDPTVVANAQQSLTTTTNTTLNTTVTAQ